MSYGRDWDLYFLNIARVVGRNSKCHSRKIGSVLVKDKSIISTGYNGPPRNVPPCDTRMRFFFDDVSNKRYVSIDDEVFEVSWDAHTHPCPRYAIKAVSGERLDLCPAAHAEANTIFQAAKIGICTNNSILYCYCGPPCKECTKALVNAGVSEIVCLDTRPYDKLSVYIVEHSGIKITRYDSKEVEQVGESKFGVIVKPEERVY